MCDYAFYVDWELEGQEENFRVGIFLSKNLLGQGYRKQTFFFRPYVHIDQHNDPFLFPLICALSGWFIVPSVNSQKYWPH